MSPTQREELCERTLEQNDNDITPYDLIFIRNIMMFQGGSDMLSSKFSLSLSAVCALWRYKEDGHQEEGANSSGEHFDFQGHWRYWEGVFILVLQLPPTSKGPKPGKSATRHNDGKTFFSFYNEERRPGSVHYAVLGTRPARFLDLYRLNV